MDFLWGDGKGVDPSAWQQGEPDSNDWVTRLKAVGDDILLTGTESYQYSKHYVCEQVSG